MSPQQVITALAVVGCSQVLLDACDNHDYDAFEIVCETNGIACSEELFEEVIHYIDEQGAVQTLNSQEGDITMSDVKSVESRTYVYGQDIATMSDDALVASINRLTKEIDANKEVLQNVDSTKIAAKVEKLMADRAAIVAILDSRE